LNATATQLNIAFETRQSVRQKLRAGDFCLLIDYCVPPAAGDVIKLALAPGVALARQAECDSRVAGLSIGLVDCAAPVDQVLEVLRDQCHDIVVRLCGRGASETAVRQLLATLQSNAVGTVIATTGYADPAHRDGPPEYVPDGYIDSCRLIQLIREHYPEMCVGAAVNPFKYNIADVHLQYFKMARKLNFGAEFIVTDAGWDMKKYQELQWFLQSRNMSECVLARLTLIRPAEIRAVLDSPERGTVISREMAALLERESNINETQAMAAQIRRTALAAAGCRLFGYSGIQVGGVTDPKLAATVVDQVTDAFDEFTDFRRWLVAWNDFHDRIEMAPTLQKYYMFKRLMDAEYPTYTVDETLHAPGEIAAPSRSDQYKYKLAKALRLESRSGPVFDLARQVLCGYRKGRDWQLDKTWYVCAAACPKGLEYGACSGSRPDGTCELGSQTCVYHRILALANWQNELERLEASHDDR
jgi:methylenetetrahydrofolate reductase (NADPH)